VIGLDPLAIELQGTTLIEASAGTGKTFTISTLYLRFLLERELEVGEILVVTYTRAATAELRDRIRTRLGEAIDAIESFASDPSAKSGDETLDAIANSIHDDEARSRALRKLNDALSNFDEAAILTIHGFCQRVLQENAFESATAFDVEFLADEGALREEVVSDFWARSLADIPEGFVRYLAGRKISRETFLELAKHATGSAPPVLTPEPGPGPTDAQFQQWRGTFDRADAIWSAERKAILALVLDAAKSKDLKNGTYKPSNLVETLGKNMDEAFAMPSFGFTSGNKRFVNLTRGGLNQGTSKNGNTPEHSFFDVCEELLEIDSALASALNQQLIGLQQKMISYLREQLRIRKDAAGNQSYDDLIVHLAEALRGREGEGLARRIRSRHCAALIDEFQDTDELQYEILRRVWHAETDTPVWNKERPPALFLIGDPKQAIYSFRGADVYTYLSAKEDAARNRYTLDTNWRSDPTLIRGVNTLFSRSSSAFLIDGIPFEEVKPRPNSRDLLERDADSDSVLEFLWLPEDPSVPTQKDRLQAELSTWVAGDIARLLESDTKIDGQPVTPGDVAVLCRSNKQAHLVASALESIGIPAALLGTTSVFDANEAKEVQRLLAAMAEPTDAGAIRVALATSVFGLGSSELFALRSDELAWNGWFERFHGWHQLWLERGFIRTFHQLNREAGVHLRLLALPGGERRLTNYLHLAELLETAAGEEHLGPRGLIKWLSRMRSSRDARGNSIGDEGELRLESDAKAVKLVTVHKSKGIEYPIVYCPFLWVGDSLGSSERKWVRFHDRGNENRLTLDLGSDDTSAQMAMAEEESRAEGLRLLYVALTRARHRCSIVWGHFPGAGASAIFYLLHGLDAASPNPLGKEEIKRYKEMHDSELLAVFEGLVAESQGGVRLRDLSRELAKPLARGTGDVKLASRSPKREISTLWRHSSFSALASTAPRTGHSPRPADEGIDHDAHVADPALSLGEGARQDVMLHAFPAGAAAGTLLHSILEHIDFSLTDSRDWGEIIEDTLRRNGFETSWRSVLVEALGEIVKTRWDEAGPSLAEILRERRMDEMEFLLPVGAGNKSIDPNSGMRVADLAEVFAKHASTPFMHDYADRLSALRFEPLAGYLKGFIDLVFEWQGRVFHVEYKNNKHRTTPPQYQPEALLASMAEHHYVLQYHLYTVALHRHLATRLRDYEYDLHMGGAYYLFLRGMAPNNALGCGIYRDRPTRDLIEALSELLSESTTTRTVG
jgi:exodeoxyribonuclease V beta subunit